MRLLDIQAQETYLDLTEWVRGNLPTGSLHVNESGEVIIHTGLELGMAGELEPIEYVCPMCEGGHHPTLDCI